MTDEQRDPRLDMPYRPELPERPFLMRNLPLFRGYPVPRFVRWFDGVPDFRVMDQNHMMRCVQRRLCWICGGTIGRKFAYNVGPMCAINLTSAEPPSHVLCADYSARACPFLSRPHAKRREQGIEKHGLEPLEPAGIMIGRNPGVALVWISQGVVHLKRDPNGRILFHLATAIECKWYAEGRPATHDEVMHSINTGLPILESHCLNNQDRQMLKLMTEDAMQLVPSA